MDWLKNIRVSRGKTQEQVAEQVQMARGAYANIENGERRPSVHAAKRIAAVLDFEWTRFFEDPGERKGSESA